MRTQHCRKSCCSVTFCPLVPAWATTIHKFQGMEAGFDKNDQFQHLIIHEVLQMNQEGLVISQDGRIGFVVG